MRRLAAQRGHARCAIGLPHCYCQLSLSQQTDVAFQTFRLKEICHPLGLPALLHRRIDHAMQRSNGPSVQKRQTAVGLLAVGIGIADRLAVLADYLLYGRALLAILAE